MDVSTLILIGFFLVSVLALALILFFKTYKVEANNATQNTYLDSLQTPEDVIKNPSSTSQELQAAMHELQLSTKKLLITSNEELDSYASLLKLLCKHPNTNKKLIIEFEKIAQEKNPQYKKEIAKALNDAFL